ncbi:hypothetical protein HAX54_037588, partial [Datura stramonium]|nr:hypothetical protein [Datura stramonium]
MVWGKKVDITPEAINSIYLAERVHPGTGFIKRLVARDDQYAWVPSVINEGHPFWAVLKGTGALVFDRWKKHGG